MSGFRLPFPRNIATQVTFAHGKTEGIVKPVRVQNGSIVLDVSETPVLITYRPSAGG